MPIYVCPMFLSVPREREITLWFCYNDNQHNLREYDGIPQKRIHAIDDKPKIAELIRSYLQCKDKVGKLFFEFECRYHVRQIVSFVI